MGMFEWQPQFSVGIPSIDGQHQNLFKMARELHDAMSKGQGRQVVGRLLDRLIHYTTVHFAHEERLMEQYQYPGYADHKAEHVALTQKVMDFQHEFEEGRVPMTVELLRFLKGWLEHHIQESDQEYIPFLRGKVVA
jgi:hemerythrin